MIDVFCKNEKCPVCGGEMGCFDVINFYDYAYCKKNNCYNIDEGVVYFFEDDRFYFNLLREEEKIIDRINYWKENDRYLMKIIAGE